MDARAVSSTPVAPIGPRCAPSRRRYPLRGGRRGPRPLALQLEMVSVLYEEIAAEHGERIGAKHARKHLGWALDTAAEGVGAPPAILKHWRSRVLTAPSPLETRQ